MFKMITKKRHICIGVRKCYPLQKPKKVIKVVNGYKPTYYLTIKANALFVQNEKDLSINKKRIRKEIKSDLLKIIEKSEVKVNME